MSVRVMALQKHKKQDWKHVASLCRILNADTASPGHLRTAVPPAGHSLQSAKAGTSVKTSIRDISKSTGFSPATVSNALNHKKNVSRSTADTILKAAKEMGYFKENTISNLKLVIFRKDGSIIDNTPFFPILIAGFELEGRENGYETVLFNLDQRSEDYEENLQLLLHQSESAVVFLATEMAEEDIKRLSDAESPILLLDNWTNAMEFNSVVINNIDSAFHAACYLIEHGHRQIGYVKSTFRIHNFQSRHEGMLRALTKHGLMLEDRFVFEVGPNIQDARADMLACLKSGRELPSALFADNDLMALGVMRALRENNIDIPGDISIIGFDDLSYSAVSYPPLSTVCVPNEDLGRLAARRIVNMMKYEDPTVLKAEVGTEFVPRGTVRRIG